MAKSGKASRPPTRKMRCAIYTYRIEVQPWSSGP